MKVQNSKLKFKIYPINFHVLRINVISVYMVSDKSRWAFLGNSIPQRLDNLFSGIRNRYFLNTDVLFCFSNTFGDIRSFPVRLATPASENVCWI